MTNSKQILTQKIKDKARAIGFNAVGIAKAEQIEGFDQALQLWLKSGYQAEMSYLERNIEKRCDPTVLVEGAKTVISLILSYYPNEELADHLPKIAKYAYGIDYHFVLKDKMDLLWKFIELDFPELEGRMFVDSAPVSDKLWAVKAGLGWLGKNSCLINKEIGSFVFICELILNIELDYDEPYKSNFCGGCTKCIDACPTKAIVQPGVIDSNKCISYQTIENKSDTIPQSIIENLNNRIFGCDICQDVCPWNKIALKTSVSEFYPKSELYQLDLKAWQGLHKDEFDLIFKRSALKRAKYNGLQRNLKALSKKE